jgi:hypothetical protein
MTVFGITTSQVWGQVARANAKDLDRDVASQVGIVRVDRPRPSRRPPSDFEHHQVGFAGLPATGDPAASALLGRFLSAGAGVLPPSFEFAFQARR